MVVLGHLESFGFNSQFGGHLESADPSEHANSVVVSGGKYVGGCVVGLPRIL